MPTPYIGIARPVVVTDSSPADYKLGPFNSINDALTALPQAVRYKGMTVIIIDNNIATEYWFKSGVLNENLIPKETDNVVVKLTQQEYDDLYDNNLLDEDVLYVILD